MLWRILYLDGLAAFQWINVWKQDIPLNVLTHESLYVELTKEGIRFLNKHALQRVGLKRSNETASLP